MPGIEWGSSESSESSEEDDSESEGGEGDSDGGQAGAAAEVSAVAPPVPPSDLVPAAPSAADEEALDAVLERRSLHLPAGLLSADGEAEFADGGDDDDDGGGGAGGIGDQGGPLRGVGGVQAAALTREARARREAAARSAGDIGACEYARAPADVSGSKFASMVPVMAQEYPFELDTFQKQESIDLKSDKLALQVTMMPVLVLVLLLVLLLTLLLVLLVLTLALAPACSVCARRRRRRRSSCRPRRRRTSTCPSSRRTPRAPSTSTSR